MIKEQIITKIDEIQNTLARIVVLDFFMAEGGVGSEKIKETKSYGKRRKKYEPKGDITAAARELASPEGIDIAKAKAYVAYTRMEAGVESRVMKFMNQHEAGKIDLGQLEWGLKKEFGVAYKEAYVFGQHSVGFSGDLMDEDLSFIKSFKRTENKFLGKFMKAIAAEKLVMNRYERLKMYVGTIRTVFDHARVEASPDWVKIYWTPSRGARHCPDCLILAINSPYTKKTLPTTPRAGDTRCLCITTPDSRILTKRGWIAIADVKEGDLVFTHMARWKKVLKTHRNKPNKSHVQAWIKAPTGKMVGVTSDHRFLTSQGWESIKNIDKLKLPMYYIKHEYLPNMWSENPHRQQAWPMYYMSQYLSKLWSKKRLPSEGMYFLRYESEGKTTMGEPIIKEQDQNSSFIFRNEKAERIQRSNRSKFYFYESRWSEICFLLGRWKETIYLQISMALDLCQWSHSRRLYPASQRPKSIRRQFGKYEINAGWRAFIFAHDRGAEEAISRSARARVCGGSPRMDVPGMWQSISGTSKRRKRSKKILFNQMPEKSQAITRMDMQTMWEKIQGSLRIWRKAKEILFPRLLQKSQKTILYDLTVEDDQSFIVEGLVAHNSNCKCHLMIRYKKPDDTEPIPEGIKPPGEEYELQPDLYGKFKGDVPEFRFFLDKNTGNPIAARKEFVAAVKKAKVGFTPSNYDDPYNRKFFKSNKIWFDTQKIREIEKTVTSMSPEGIVLRKKRQDLMKDLLKANTELNKKGFRWIRPDGYGGYTVGADGKPFTLMPKD
ncbi:hypothetical protein KAR91_75455 [Candidatus Pacearchaeota archaeon]|nr:hypothetical protein [Candidatus Pacearchaeota archaeon]